MVSNSFYVYTCACTHPLIIMLLVIVLLVRVLGLIYIALSFFEDGILQGCDLACI